MDMTTVVNGANKFLPAIKKVIADEGLPVEIRPWCCMSMASPLNNPKQCSDDCPKKGQYFAVWTWVPARVDEMRKMFHAATKT